MDGNEAQPLPRLQPPLPDVTVTPPSLAAKLVDASLDVEHVEKRGENTQQNYHYATAEDVIGAATKALLQRQILSEFEPTPQTLLPTPSGKGFIAVITGRMIVTDAETGESVVRSAMGSGADTPGDKAISKGITAARKIAYLSLLSIPIGDDPDADGGRTRREQIASPPKLDKERVKALMDLIEKRRAAGMRFDDLALAMGEAGIDAPEKRSIQSVQHRVSRLTTEQADALEAVLAKEAS